MIARVYENVSKTIMQKVKKEVQKERLVKKKVESWEEKLVEQAPQEGYCGRCGRAYKYGDNSLEPDKCPRCVCIRCKESIMERRRSSTHGGSINRCYPHWYEDTYGRKYYGSIRGWEITYPHKYPKKLPPVKKKVLVEKEVQSKEVYSDVIEVMEPVSITETKVVDVVNIPYNSSNKLTQNIFYNYKLFVEDYLNLNKFFKDTDLSKYNKWYGSKSHNQVLELLRLSTNIEKVMISHLAPIEYNQLIVGEKQYLEEFASVVGFYPNVPAYIQGHPLNMYNNKRIYKPDIERSVNIYFNATMDSKNFDNQYKNRGIICYSIIDYLINEEKVNVNLKVIDASFISGETLIQQIDFDSYTINNDMETVFNFLTTSAVLRVMMLEHKASMVNSGKLNKAWLDGFGYIIDSTNIKKILNLNENDILFGTPDEHRISGFDIEDDFINCLDSLGLDISYEFDNSNDLSIDSSVLSTIDVKDIIKQRNITKLIHFTSQENIESIKKNGILSRDKMINDKIDFDYNDHLRLDNHLDAICLSVQIPNKHLIDCFHQHFPDKMYKIIEIDPAILYQINHNNKPVKRIYFDYNAASRYSKSSTNNMNIMFQKEIRKRSIVHNRYDLNSDNIPTSDQAEILFFSDIPSKYILNIIDYKEEINDSTNQIAKALENNSIIESKTMNSMNDYSQKIDSTTFISITRNGVINRNVCTYNLNIKNIVKIPFSSVYKAYTNKEKIFIKIGKEYSFKELVGKIVLLSRINKVTDTVTRYYFNEGREVAIGEKNIEYFFKYISSK